MKLTAAKKERRIFRVLLILMIFSLLVTGCGQNADTDPDNDGKDPDTSIGENPDTSIGESPDNGNGETNTNEGTNPDNGNGETDTNVVAVLESGFKPSDDACEIPLFYCAYRSDKTEFDIDDVTLDFYYGGWFTNLGIEYDLQLYNFPMFDIYFTNDAHDRCFVKRVEENLVSEKYRCKFIDDDDWNATEIIFNHSESITIPREIFTENEGVIYFAIYSKNANHTVPEVEWIAGKAIFYKIIGEKVILSNLPFS